jgi:hypothetical protein
MVYGPRAIRRRSCSARRSASFLALAFCQLEPLEQDLHAGPAVAQRLRC